MDKSFCRTLPTEVYKNYPYVDFKFSSFDDFFGKNNHLVYNGVTANSINQNDLGDCFFLNALSCLCQRTSLLTNILPYQSASSLSAYTLHLNFNGRPTAVLVDDLTPTFDRGFPPHLLFASPNYPKVDPNTNKIYTVNYTFPNLLEKAYAKLFGGFHKLDLGGGSTSALRDLCGGAPCEELEFEDYFDEKKHIDGKGW